MTAGSMTVEVFIDGDWVSTERFECVPSVGDSVVVQDKRTLYPFGQAMTVRARVCERVFYQDRQSRVDLLCEADRGLAAGAASE